ncbi:MAG: hypothetical protein ACJATT_005919 [Myxococcota bacterium]|jgi:hypothetical protein
MKPLLLVAILATIFAAACTSDQGEADSAVGTDLNTEVDTGLDTDTLIDISVECEPLTVDLGVTTGTGDCVNTERLAAASATALRIRADCTDPNITGVLDKRHLVLIPDSPTQDALWLHLGGTDGSPTGTENIGAAAISAGYRYISLAYTNVRGATDRCRCPEGPRDAHCSGLTRYEVIYGDDVTDLFNMDANEAIEPRLAALLASLHDARPLEGWDHFLTDAGDPDWTQMALSGFSQGGGMVGIIARDHALDRVMYFSSGSDSALRAQIEPSSYQACSAHDECDSGLCCPVVDPFCITPSATDSICIEVVGALVTTEGQDTDDDGIGEGGPELRATPGDRQFGLVHREEGAWMRSPGIWESWGMGDTLLDADTATQPYASDVRLFSTGLPPRNSCSEHQSMGADTCQPRNEDGTPAMQAAWLHAMTIAL